ncbi:calcium uptake protein 1, mitochondrial-like isoform X1 [Symsagittifera roscoffensis]|uniref:calcium uptake protein 1, mitochondrial-like isoform X1 n=1 Tax=Symsagittifera roscoffensis TaxID=84072 RepID=UPI00307BEFCF
MPLLGSSSGPNEASEEPKENEADKKKKKTGFRDQKVIEYENRIKLYSTPDKIFRYYATLQVGKEKEVYMTPADFVRSIIPDSKQPEGLGLDKFKMFDPETDSCVDELEIGEDSFFHKLGQQGLISFSDYVFLLTVLSTPAKNFEFAFKVFDINGDGVVEHHEFEQVASVIRASGSVGKRHRDHKTTGNVIKKGSGGVSSALATYFFGPNLDQKLSIGDFLKFQQELHRGVLELECKKQCKEGDSMSEKQFSKLLLMYLQQSQGRKKEMLNRINKLYGRKNSQDQQDNPVVTERIPLEDVYAFWDVLTRLNEVEHAITFWTLSGAPIDKDTFKHVTRIVGKRELNEHLVEVLFQLFDDNGDGMLTHQEFFDVMKRRVWRNLRRRRDMGLHRLLSACGTCLKTTDFLTPLKKTIGWN